MTPQHLVAIIARLAAIWLAIKASDVFVEAWTVALSAHEDQMVWPNYIAPAIRISAAVLLWFFPLHVARALLPPRCDDVTPSIDPRAAAAAGCAIIGVLAVVYAMPGTMTFIGGLIFDVSVQISDPLSANKIQILRSVGQLIVGIVLIAQANAIGASITVVRRK